MTQYFCIILRGLIGRDFNDSSFDSPVLSYSGPDDQKVTPEGHITSQTVSSFYSHEAGISRLDPKPMDENR